ncbi:MAG: VanZ family protein [Candidatus Omnitrophica bacterium]|nr:VanZ family protein [Candidatus Omnitrophota bacterium]MCB9747812.1 VanZ family protein [Candidatus Omnitrophota bacterium]
MSNIKQQRRIWWMAAGLWLGVIYSTLSLVRPVCEYLKTNTPFALFVNLMMGSFLSGLIIIILRTMKIKSVQRMWFLSGVVILYIVGFWMVEHPEEKLHLIEYGLLAYLIFKALQMDVHRVKAYIGAFVLTSLCGWGDEIIQHYLPNRYYQVTDVQLNIFSGLLGLLLTYVMEEDGWLMKDEGAKR